MMHFFRNTLLLIAVSWLTIACTESYKPTKKQVAIAEKGLLAEPYPLKTVQPGKYLETLLPHEGDLSNTLVILDLDDTVITSPEGQWLGRSEMFYDLLNKELKASPGRSKKEIAEAIDPLLIEVYKRVPVVLTDKCLPEAIKQYQKKGALVIGMTARGHMLWDTTPGTVR